MWRNATNQLRSIAIYAFFSGVLAFMIVARPAQAFSAASVASTAAKPTINFSPIGDMFNAVGWQVGRALRAGKILVTNPFPVALHDWEMMSTKHAVAQTESLVDRANSHRNASANQIGQAITLASYVAADGANAATPEQAKRFTIWGTQALKHYESRVVTDFAKRPLRNLFKICKLASLQVSLAHVVHDFARDAAKLELQDREYLGAVQEVVMAWQEHVARHNITDREQALKLLDANMPDVSNFAASEQFNLALQSIDTYVKGVKHDSPWTILPGDPAHVRFVRHVLRLYQKLTIWRIQRAIKAAARRDAHPFVVLRLAEVLERFAKSVDPKAEKFNVEKYVAKAMMNYPAAMMQHLREHVVRYPGEDTASWKERFNEMSPLLEKELSSLKTLAAHLERKWGNAEHAKTEPRVGGLLASTLALKDAFAKRIRSFGLGRKTSRYEKGILHHGAERPEEHSLTMKNLVRYAEKKGMATQIRH